LTQIQIKRALAYLISPVKAPPLRTQQFWAATWKSGRSKPFTTGRNTNGGLTTTSANKKKKGPLHHKKLEQCEQNYSTAHSTQRKTATS
jgi:hypothetical protein